MAWLVTWENRIKITIDRTDIDAALSNFPVLIYLSASSGHSSRDVSCVFDELGSDANRKKIAVTKADGTTECYVEIEKWDDASEKAWLWVKVPSVASGADTELYLYYDRTHADNDAYVGDPSDAVVHDVWDDNFKLVTHMQDDPNTSHVRDSTQYTNDGTKKASNEPIETGGEIDKGQDFDGDNDYIDFGYAESISPTTTITISVWVKLEATAKNQLVIRGRSTHGYRLFVWTDDNLYTDIGIGTIQRLINVDAFVGKYGAWHRIDTTWGDSVIKHFIDGSQLATTKLNVNPPIDYAYDNPLYLGRYYDETIFLDGSMDEVRISDIVRPPAWIKASYESGRDHLIDFGSEEKILIERFQEEGTDFRETKFGATWG